MNKLNKRSDTIDALDFDPMSIDVPKQKVDLIELLKAFHKEFPVPDNMGTHGYTIPNDLDPKYVLVLNLFLKLKGTYMWVPMQFEESDLYLSVEELVTSVKEYVFLKNTEQDPNPEQNENYQI